MEQITPEGWNNVQRDIGTLTANSQTVFHRLDRIDEKLDAITRNGNGFPRWLKYTLPLFFTACGAVGGCGAEFIRAFI